MENDKLDEILVTAIEALKFFVESPRTVMPNGDVIVKLTKHSGIMEDELMYRISDAKMALQQIPYLATLLEIRVLEIQQHEAQKRLAQLKRNK